jgi:hypothetical protein
VKVPPASSDLGKGQRRERAPTVTILFISFSAAQYNRGADWAEAGANVILDGDVAAGLGVGDAGGGEVSDAAIEVILELAVEAALQGPAAEPVQELDHRLPSSKIRLTAPERRAQLSFSTASWRRPACVRE